MTSTTHIHAADARRAARNAGALAAASILSKGALFGWQLILIPLLGPFEYGVYGTVGALLAIGQPVTSFAFGVIVIRDVARYPDRAGRYWSVMLLMQTLFALVAYVGINVGAGAAAYSETIRAFVALAGISLIVDMFGNMANELLLARERMVYTSLVEVGHIALRLALAGGALLAGYGLLGVYLATIVSGLVRWWVLWLLLLRTGVRPQWPFDKTIAWPLLLNSAPLAFNAFITLAYQHADKLMTTHFIGEAGTGYLTAAFVVVFGVIEILSTTVLIATFPMMSRYHGSDTFGFMVEKLSFFTALASLPLALALGIVAADIIVPFLGEDWRPTAAVLSILIWYTLVTMVGNVYAQGMMAQNRQRTLMGIRVTGLAINLSLNVLLLPRLGVQGAALATVSAEVTVVSFMLATFHTQGWQRHRVLSRLGRLIPLGAAAGLCMVLLGKIHPMLGVVSGLVLYAVGVLFGRVLAEDDWDLLYRLVAAMPGGSLIRRFWKRDTPINW